VSWLSKRKCVLASTKMQARYEKKRMRTKEKDNIILSETNDLLFVTSNPLLSTFKITPQASTVTVIE
jgi:hypothetical protein